MHVSMRSISHCSNEPFALPSCGYAVSDTYRKHRPSKALWCRQAIHISPHLDPDKGCKICSQDFSIDERNVKASICLYTVSWLPHVFSHSFKPHLSPNEWRCIAPLEDEAFDVSFPSFLQEGKAKHKNLTCPSLSEVAHSKLQVRLWRFWC